MKLDKNIVDRRVGLLAEEGIEFRTGVSARADDLRNSFDAIVLCCGAPRPRDLDIEGRELNGIHFAMDFLAANTKRVLDSSAGERFIDVSDKNVIVIGGGDTGTDCVATSLRQKCKSLVQFEIMPAPPDRQADHDGWLSRARTFQVDYGHEEAAAVFGSDPREYSMLTKCFIGSASGDVVGLDTVEAAFTGGSIEEIAGTEKRWTADVVLLAMGFTGVEKSILLDDLGVAITDRNTIAVDENKQTNVENVFAAGDCERGQSLIVWAIADGRKAAASVDQFLKTSDP